MRLAVLALPILAGCTQHPASASFAWEGRPGDAWVRIRNLDGDGDVRLATVNGSTTSHFALQGSRKSRHGTLGEGGRAIRLEAVNGSVRLRRRG